ncbi:hypothetical protein OB13_18210 [Pontibacter sp. HJ8]
MKHTVIGIFEYGVDAQMAAQQLMSSGIPSGQVDIALGHTAARVTSTPEEAYRKERSGRVSKLFDSLFGDKHESEKYSRVAEHSAVVTVHAQSEAEARRAAELLDKYGAVDVDEHEEKLRTRSAEDKTGSSTAAPATPTGTIPVIEENVHIGKRDVETGGVRLRSRILERPVEEHLRLREEHLEVERHPVNRPATEKDVTNFQEGEIEIVEHAEVPVVKKEQRVVEEIRLHKETSEHDETIRETERKQQVDTERIRTDRDPRAPGYPEDPQNR